MEPSLADPRPSPALFLVFAVLTCLVGCTDKRPRLEAAACVRLIDQLRDAPNEHKAEPLALLQQFSCTLPDICAAKDACSVAFQHHVKGMQAGQRLKLALASDAGPPDADKDSLAQWLLEMNVEIEEAKSHMPDCEDRVGELRVRYKP